MLGLAAIGGLVYFVADGQTPIPTMDWLWGFDGSEYGNGNLVAFHLVDPFFSPAGNHGQGTTSAADRSDPPQQATRRR